MNDHAVKLEMNQTHYDSPHGLANADNYSTAYDVGKLSSVAIKNEYFRKICSTQNYECTGISKKVVKYCGN